MAEWQRGGGVERGVGGVERNAARSSVNLSFVKKEHYKSVIVTTEDEVIKLANKGYDCQILGGNKWLMRRKLTNGLDSNG